MLPTDTGMSIHIFTARIDRVPWLEPRRWYQMATIRFLEINWATTRRVIQLFRRMTMRVCWRTSRFHPWCRVHWIQRMSSPRASCRTSLWAIRKYKRTGRFSTKMRALRAHRLKRSISTTVGWLPTPFPARWSRRLTRKISKPFCRNTKDEARRPRSWIIRFTVKMSFWRRISVVRSAPNSHLQQIDQIACRPTGGKRRTKRWRTGWTRSNLSRFCRRANEIRPRAQPKRLSRPLLRAILLHRRQLGLVVP